jgi:hypothetical protein
MADDKRPFGDGDSGPDPSDGSYGPAEPAGEPFETDAGHPPALEDD